MLKPALLCTLQGCSMFQDAIPDANGSRRVWFQSDADIDADGANGETLDRDGRPIFAYKPGNEGVDDLRNAGYPHGAYHDILVCPDDKSAPLIINGGFLSKTAYFRREKAWHDPDRYLDSASIPYIVIEDFIRRQCAGVALGSRCRVTNTVTKKSCEGIVGDLGPLYKIGELSMAMARAIGVDPNPRTGGESRRTLVYEFWPGTPAVIGGETFDLIKRA